MSFAFDEKEFSVAEYDLKSPDSYTQHLAEVNQTNTVIATEDIFNSNGILLVRKGLPIRPDVAQKILSHKLVKPMETTINVDRSIGAQQLLDQISGMLVRFPDCRIINNALCLDELLMEQCRAYASHPLLVQKITVLAMRLPDLYEKALFCAWFALCVGVQMGMKSRELNAAFLAGLMHDTGMLHISPDLLGKEGRYTPEEWRMMQGHALIADAFLAYVEELPDGVRRAVREHHERSDGTGYPFALFEDRLSALGQVVAITDTLCGIRNRSHCITGKAITLVESVPLLQVNSAVHPPAVYSAVIQVLRLVNPPATPALEGRSFLQTLDLLIEQRQKLVDAFQVALTQQSVLQELRHPRAKSVLLMLNRLWSLVIGSGFIDDPLMRWIEHVREQRLYSAEREIFELSLMYEEFNWQLSRLGRLLGLLSENADVGGGQVCQQLAEVGVQIGTQLKSEGFQFASG